MPGALVGLARLQDVVGGLDDHLKLLVTERYLKHLIRPKGQCLRYGTLHGGTEEHTISKSGTKRRKMEAISL